MIGAIIVTEWLLTIVGAVAFLFALGAPWRSVDPEMKWHLWWGAVVAGLQPMGLLLAGISLWPAVLTEGAAMAILYWRLALLIQTRRRQRQDGRTS